MRSSDKTHARSVAAVSAALCAATYVFGIVMLLGPLADAPLSQSGSDPKATLAMITENAGLLRLWYLVIYMANGLALAVLVVSLRALSPRTLGTGLLGAYGLICAAFVIAAGAIANVGLQSAQLAISHDAIERAADLWMTTQLMENAIGGGNEIMGAVWISGMAITLPFGGVLFRAFGLSVGVCGLMTLVPFTQDFAGMTFGIGAILWFAACSVTLLRNRTPVPCLT